MGSDLTAVAFYASDSPALKRALGMGSKPVQAYGCVRCKNLQFTVKFDERDLERYLQFEGEQPGVLERINSDPKKLND